MFSKYYPPRGPLIFALKADNLLPTYLNSHPTWLKLVWTGLNFGRTVVFFHVIYARTTFNRCPDTLWKWMCLCVTDRVFVEFGIYPRKYNWVFAVFKWVFVKSILGKLTQFFPYIFYTTSTIFYWVFINNLLFVTLSLKNNLIFKKKT